MSNKWKLRNIETGEIKNITKSIFKIGRNVNADILSDSNLLSRNHAQLSILIDGLYVQDNKSLNGTFVNGKKIEAMEMQKLMNGDQLGFGGDSKTTKPTLQLPFTFEVIMEDDSGQQASLSDSTLKKSFCTINDNDFIVISDDDDDDPIASSQLFQFTENIKKEPFSKFDGIFDDIKKELNDLDYCNKEIEVDLTEEACHNTNDLLNILEFSGDDNLPQEATGDLQGSDGIESKSAVNQNECAVSKESVKEPSKDVKEKNVDPRKVKKRRHTIGDGNAALSKKFSVNNNQSDEVKEEIMNTRNKRKQRETKGEFNTELVKKGTQSQKESSSDDNLPKETKSHLQRSDEIKTRRAVNQNECSVSEESLEKPIIKDVKEKKIIDPRIEKKRRHTISHDNAALSNEFSSSNNQSDEDKEKIINTRNKRKERETVGEINTELEKKDNKISLLIDLTAEEESNSIQKSDKDHKSTIRRGPTIVEPHVMQPKTRKTPEKKVENKGKRKNTKDSVATKKLKTSPASKVTPKISNNEKAAIVNERKKRLRNLASFDKSPVDSTSPTKVQPKVKVSDSRGQFLLQPINMPSTSTRKSPRRLVKPTTNTRSEKTIVSNKPKAPVQSETLPKNNTKFQTDAATVIVDLTYSINKSNFNHVIPPQNSPAIRQNECDNVDSEIEEIVQWPIQWLKEQSNMDISPPVYKDSPCSIPNVFKDYKEYHRVMTPFVFLELWQHMYQDVSIIRDVAREPILVTVVHERRVGTICYLDCQCTLDEKNPKTYIRSEDLALIELKLKDTNCYKYVGFGFIKTCGKMNRNDRSKPNFAFTIIIRNCEGKKRLDNNLLIQVFSNIGNSLRLFRTMKCLSSSSICNKVLDPNVGVVKLDSRGPTYSSVRLNPEQRKITIEASNFCLGHDNGFYLLRGPPGTGKSTVIVNIILEILFKSQKTGQQPLILLTAPSNAAVDCLIMKLAEYRSNLEGEQRRYLKMIRTGPETSISKHVDKFKLTYFAQKDVLAQSQLQYSTEFKNWMDNGGELNVFLQKQLKHQYYFRMKTAEDKVLLGSNVICTTLNSCVSYRLLQQVRKGHLKFTCCIIDEATQCTELESLLPLQLGIDKFVLVGDPQQLPAVICNKDAQKYGFDQSLFSRIGETWKINDNSQIRMLYSQYRMAPEICEYPNKAFYESKLKSHPICTNLLQPRVKPYLLFNLKTAHEDLSEYINQQEVTLISILLQNLSSTVRTKEYSIGIITPYKAQKELLKRSINNIRFESKVDVTVNTVDSFQGMENDIIIISCVRYNPNSFLASEKRLNVALTRAKQALYVVGNYTLFKLSRPLYNLREDAKNRQLCFDINIESVKSLHRFIFK